MSDCHCRFAVYDYEESLEFGYEEWEKVFGDQSMTIDEVITKVYSDGVEAVVDLPHSFFFEQFFRRWPDAKVRNIGFISQYGDLFFGFVSQYGDPFGGRRR